MSCNRPNPYGGINFDGVYRGGASGSYTGYGGAYGCSQCVAHLANQDYQLGYGVGPGSVIPSLGENAVVQPPGSLTRQQTALGSYYWDQIAADRQEHALLRIGQSTAPALLYGAIGLVALLILVLAISTY